MVLSIRSSVSKTLPTLRRTFIQRRTQATVSSFREWRATSTKLLHKDYNSMATPTKIHLTVNETGIIQNRPPTEEAAVKASELLQENHDVPSSLNPILNATFLTRDRNTTSSTTKKASTTTLPTIYLHSMVLEPQLQ
jgi:hypothetical protein